jgi:hypothetical protein
MFYDRSVGWVVGWVGADNVVNLRKPPQEPFVDEGGGSVEVWAIEDGKPTFTKLPAEERGHFYSGGTCSRHLAPFLCVRAC